MKPSPIDSPSNLIVPRRATCHNLYNPVKCPKKHVFPGFRENSGLSGKAHQIPPIYKRSPIQRYQILEDWGPASWLKLEGGRPEGRTSKKFAEKGLSCPGEGPWVLTYLDRLKGLIKTYPTVYRSLRSRSRRRHGSLKKRIFDFYENNQLRSRWKLKMFKYFSY